MSRNSLLDLNEYLFEQLDALSNPDLTDEKLTEQITRAKTITSVAQTVINNANTMLNAVNEARGCAMGRGNDGTILKLSGESNEVQERTP